MERLARQYTLIQHELEEETDAVPEWLCRKAVGCGTVVGGNLNEDGVCGDPKVKSRMQGFEGKTRNTPMECANEDLCW
jgi:hypothetical protein